MNETEIFAKVIAENDPDRRLELVEELCADQALKSRVKKLVEAHESPRSFIDDPFLGQTMDRTSNASTPGLVKAGETIGPYKLLQQIGEGGMGLVFMAEQTQPVKRRVALKVIKPGMDTREVIARFEAERQALAMMDHPNIAKVLDADATESGYPYFVMELVNGLPIGTYCDNEKLSTEQRLRIFSDVCRAVHHAHQKGVIHRDLKPSNILVAEYDGKPVPKVIDFGVAKATGLALTEKTLFTEFGQVIGTIEYMSPEQSRRNQLDIDTRSDIYSLGVVLYKLLTGETPFGSERFKKAAWEEMMKIIREEDPQLPSVRIGSSQSLEQIATNRNVQPTRLSSLVRGDLDWIVLKTLEKDRDRRYPSASDLADDIERHLNHLPVEAAPQSPLDRASKFARRNRGLVRNLALALLVLCFLGYLGMKGASDLKSRNTRVVEATQSAQVAMAAAENSTIGQEAPWETAEAHCQRIEESLDAGIISGDVRENAERVLADFELKKTERELAIQIEEVVIKGATHPTLESWQAMEKDMRDLFRRQGYDLDKENPAEIGKRIRDHKSSVLLADLLELWIGARAHMAMMGGPKTTDANMQPWAEAIYVADADPVRTGIRSFIYELDYRREKLDGFAKGVKLESLSPRTLSWLGACYQMVNDAQECDRIFETALRLYPRDLMLVHDYGYFLDEQGRSEEAARMFHRCIGIRSDVSGVWKSLSVSLEKLGETEAAETARVRSEALAK